jgi:hypothetical protein
VGAVLGGHPPSVVLSYELSPVLAAVLLAAIVVALLALRHLALAAELVLKTQWAQRVLLRASSRFEPDSLMTLLKAGIRMFFNTVQTFSVLVPYVPAYEDAIAGEGTVLAVVHDIVGEILFIYRKTSKAFCLHFFV